MSEQKWFWDPNFGHIRSDDPFEDLAYVPESTDGHRISDRLNALERENADLRLKLAEAYEQCAKLAEREYKRLDRFSQEIENADGEMACQYSAQADTARDIMSDIRSLIPPKEADHGAHLS